jgi:hypothetical protein
MLKDIQITRTTRTKIKFANMIVLRVMTPTLDNKCWLGTKVGSENTSLCLLNDVDVIRKVDIPHQYAPDLNWSGITMNNAGEAVFISSQSVIAATQRGTFYKMFDIPSDTMLLPTSPCFLQSGNYILVDSGVSFSSPLIYEFNSDGVQLRCLAETVKIDGIIFHIRQNHNRDIVISDNLQLVLLHEDFSLKSRVQLTDRGIVTPCMNSLCELLYGHGQIIDLLSSDGEFVKTVYETHEDKEITNISCTENGTVWILFDSDEVEIVKLEI